MRGARHSVVICGFVVSCASIFIAAHAFAQSPAWQYEAAAEVEGNFDDNSALATDGAEESQVVIAVRPSAQIRGDVRSMLDVSARYRLHYFTYSNADLLPDAPSLLHSAQARIALTRWEGVDVAAGDTLDPVGLEYGLPPDEPQNLKQRNTLFGDLSVKYQTPWFLFVAGGYDVKRVDYFEAIAPRYLYHGPSLGVGRDITPDVEARVLYEFRIQDFDKTGTASVEHANSGDLTSHGVYATVSYASTRWSVVDVRAGYQMLSAADLADPISTYAAELRVGLEATGHLRFGLTGKYGVTADLSGQPGTVAEAGVQGQLHVLPDDRLTVGAHVQFGMLDLEGGAGVPAERRQYLRADAAAEYRWIQWFSTRVGFVHHDFDGPAGTVGVNRAFVSIVGRVGNADHRS